MYTLHCTYSVQCTVYIVHTLYNVVLCITWYCTSLRISITRRGRIYYCIGHILQMTACTQHNTCFCYLYLCNYRFIFNISRFVYLSTGNLINSIYLFVYIYIYIYIYIHIHTYTHIYNSLYIDEAHI